MDDSMQVLTNSVKAVGIQTPAVVRMKEDGRYELISGHRRKMASELANMDTMPCVVRKMSNDESIIAMVDANLQREIILPSEKAWSYKMKLEAMKRQGKRTDLSSCPVGRKLDSAEEIGEQTGESVRQIYRYIRLTELVPQLLKLVDVGQMAMRPAIEISYISKEQQQSLLDAIESEECAPSQAQAVKIRKLSEEGCITDNNILSIMQEVKPTDEGYLKLPTKKIYTFFPVGTPSKKMEQTIIKALELWYSK
jgi:ParB family chromosome partitioning protein